VPDVLTTIYVEGAENNEALKKMEELHEQGKAYSDICGISDKYYFNKLKNGLVKMSAYVYFKIMGIDPNGEIITIGNAKMRLRPCIRCGKPTVLNNPYCRECNELLGRISHSAKFDKRDGGVVKETRVYN
jgi:hypothetical protein